MVATDSYRLSVKETDAGGAAAGKPRGERPGPRARRSSRASPSRRRASRSPSAWGRTRSSSSSATIVLSSRLIDGQFPNYRQLLPESVEHELRLSSAELTDVVRRISLLAQKNAPLRLSFSEGTLTVSAQTPDVGEASEAIPVPFHGEPFEIGFNPEFLRDGLESVESEELVLKLISPLRPGLIESPDIGRLRLPDHAHPPERVSVLRARRQRADARLSHLRARRGGARRGPDGRARPERRGQVEPARGALLRLHRPLAAHAQRARAGALRRATPRAWSCSSPTARRPHELGVGFGTRLPAARSRSSG